MRFWIAAIASLSVDVIVTTTSLPLSSAFVVEPSTVLGQLPAWCAIARRVARARRPSPSRAIAEPDPEPAEPIADPSPSRPSPSPSRPSPIRAHRRARAVPSPSRRRLRSSSCSPVRQREPAARSVIAMRMRYPPGAHATSFCDRDSSSRRSSCARRHRGAPIPTSACRPARGPTTGQLRLRPRPARHDRLHREGARRSAASRSSRSARTACAASS